MNKNCFLSFGIGSDPSMPRPRVTVVQPVGKTVVCVDVLSVQSLMRVIDTVELSYQRHSPYVFSNSAGALCRTSIIPVGGPQILRVPSALSA